MGKSKTEKKMKPKKFKIFLHEFREFAVKGNMFDLAVGILVGGAFSAVVNSVVTDLVTPLIGILIGVDFAEWSIALPKLYGNAKPGALAIGSFLNSVISFVVIAFIVFLFVKTINKFRDKQAELNKLRNKQAKTTPAPPAKTKEELLLTEIRDILKAQQGA